jgi:organic hydroperoxide reductase OsmC/OhrA
MQQFSATIDWARGDQSFTNQRYSRAHEWHFDGGARVPASSSPLSVPLPMSDPAGVDPEEALVAATASCHMLWFLSIAARAGHTVDAYHDEPIGLMTRNADGRLFMSRITLRPAISFALPGPDSAQLAALHHEAHQECYIANSIRAEVVVEART